MSNRKKVRYCWLFALLLFAVVAYAPQALADEADASGQEGTAIQDEAVLVSAETTEDFSADVPDEEAATDALPSQPDTGEVTSAELPDATARDQASEAQAVPESPTATETEPALEAQASTVASGKCGTCPWALDSAGKLTISAGYLASNTDRKPDFWPWNAYRSSIKSVVLSGKVNVGESMAYIFEGCTKLTSVNLTSLVGDDVDMRYAFANCTSLTTLSTKTWCDMVYLTDLRYMFSGCTALTSADFSGFDTITIRNTSYMFNECTSLATVTFTALDFDADLTGMFAGCTKLKQFNNHWAGEAMLDQLPMGEWTVRGTTTSYVKDRNGWIGERPADSGYTLVRTGKVPQNITVHNTVAVVGRDTNLWVTVSSGNYPVYELADTSLAEIDETGVVTGKAAGTTTVTITAAETEDYAKEVLVIDLTVVDSDQIEVLASGTCGTCSWELDATGTLTFLGGSLSRGRSSQGSWPWSEYRDRITEVATIGDVVCEGSVSSLFANCSSLFVVDLSGWNLSAAWETSDIFTGCTSLRLARAEGIILGTQGLKFAGLSSLESIEGTESWDTSQVTYMGGMFSGCRSLTSLDLLGWDTSAVADLNEMFSGCSSLTSLDVSGWDTSQVTNMTSVFSGCSSLTAINLTGWDTSQVTTMKEMFAGCRSLGSIDVSMLETRNVTDMSSMFKGCVSLTSLDLSSFDTSSLINSGSLCNNCTSLGSLDISGFDLSRQPLDEYGLYYIASGCYLLKSVRAYDLKLGVMGVNLGNLPILSTIDGIESWDTSRMVTMNEMFCGCRSLTSLDLSHWDVSNVTSMCDTFRFCISLVSLNLSGWNTSKVKDMATMFYSCVSLKTVDLSSFDTSRVTSMIGMFEGCDALQSIDLSGFDTSSVTNMSGMFSYCRSLKSIDVSRLDTTSVKSMNTMFEYCASLTSLDVSKWDLSKIKHVSYMLDFCPKLTKLVVGAKSAKVAQALPLGTWTAKSNKKSYVKGATKGEDAWIGAKPPAKTADTYTKTGKGSQSVEVSAKTVAVGSTVSLNAIATGGGKLSYKSSDTSYATVSSKGVVKGKKAGKVTITVTAAATSLCNKATKKVTVTVKKANPITAKAKKKTVKAAYSKVKKASVTLASNIKVSKAQGKVTYKNASTTAAAKKIKINKSTGKITVPKGLAKGTYTVKVAVKAAGNSTYAARTRNVTFKVKVS